MKEETHRTWDILLKVAVLIGAFTAFIWGLIEFRLNDERSFKKSFWLERMETCREVTTLVAKTTRIKNN